MQAAELSEPAGGRPRGEPEPPSAPPPRARRRPVREGAAPARTVPRGPDWTAVALGVGAAVARLARAA